MYIVPLFQGTELCTRPQKHRQSEGRDSEHEPCGQSESAPTSTSKEENWCTGVLVGIGRYVRLNPKLTPT